MHVRLRSRATTLGLIGVVAALVVGISPGGEAATSSLVPTPNDRPAATAALGKGTPYCGKGVVRKPSGQPWTCVFSDDFNGTRLNSSKWTIITNKTSSFGERPDCYVNSRYNIAVNYGVLKLVTRRNLYPFTCGVGKNAYRTNATSALVSSLGKFTQSKGRFQMRARFPFSTKTGIQMAFWLYPDNGNLGSLQSGEIDVAEWYSAYPYKVIPYLHYNVGALTSWASPKEVTAGNCEIDVRKFHNYTVDWTSSSISIHYDGKLCLRNTSGVRLGQFPGRYFVNMMMAQGLYQNAPTAKTVQRAEAQVDFIRVWR